jgi:hypothetical protein
MESKSLANMDREYKGLTASYPELTLMTPKSERVRGNYMINSYN